MSVIEELQAAARAAVEGVGPSTVGIGRGPGRGVGLVVAAGRVVTNAHNVRGPQATVILADERAVTADVVGLDHDGDLAVLSVEGAGPAVPSWGDTDLGVGTPVWALSRTAAGALRVTRGEVSSVGRPFRGPGGHLIRGSIEHTAPMARGSSGGPLVDGEGRVVGINTHRLGDGFYLALPTDADLRERIGALGEGRSPTRRRLGVALAPTRAARRLRAAVGLEARDGLLVQAVEDGGPAATAGVRRGDLLVSAGGRPLVDPDDLHAVLGADDAPTITLVAVRGIEEITLEVHFGPAETGGDPGSAV
ncbi:MAG: S1C family serine protease [Acidimicrobiaceae bacterium]|nr:S1C family serine protease [Acidimicrobiaceae bacterium]